MDNMNEENRNENIGRTVLAWRGDMSQKDLAEAMRLRGHKWSQNTVWQVESGSRPLRLTEAEDIADILDELPEGLERLVDPAGGYQMKHLHVAEDMREEITVSIREYMRERVLAAEEVREALERWVLSSVITTPHLRDAVRRVLSEEGHPAHWAVEATEPGKVPIVEIWPELLQRLKSKEGNADDREEVSEVAEEYARKRDGLIHDTWARWEGFVKDQAEGRDDG